MGKLKTKKTKKSRGGGMVSSAVSLASKAFGGGKSGGKSGGRRKRGPQYWANKVLVEKLKRRYNKLKYGGVR